MPGLPKYNYDLITIGAGSGGVRASRLAGGYGARSAMIEADRVGGTCVLRGCIPKKLLIYGAHYADHFEDAVNYGWTIEGAHHDWRTLIDNKNTELDRLNGIYLNILKNNNVDLHEGRGVLTDAHTVEVNGKSITAENILVAVGGWPSTPDIPGIEHVISSNEALELPALPKRMVIVGGGYVAVEFAGIFASFGTQVTEIVRADNVLRGFDEDIRTALGTELGHHGIDLITGGVVDSIEKYGAEFTLRLKGGRAIATDCIMYATGRTPNTKGLGLEEAGVALLANGGIEVDDRMRTSKPGVYAAGDVTGRDQFVYMAAHGAKVAAFNALNGNGRRYDNSAMPAVVFTDPQVASVGLTEAAAGDRGIDVKTSVLSLDNLPRALAARDTRGLIKLVAESATGRLIGAHILAPEGADSIQTAALAIKQGMTYGALGEMIFPYLTTVEGLKLAALTFDRDVSKLSCCAG